MQRTLGIHHRRVSRKPSGLPEISSGSKRQANHRAGQGKKTSLLIVSHKCLSGELVIRMYDDDLGCPADREPTC